MSTQNSIEGRLSIALDTNTESVNISSNRPVLASRLFIGKPINEVLKLLPLMFNVCGQAQGAAAIRAAESSLGRRASMGVESQRDRLILVENLREHLWRILLEWPQYSTSTRNNDAMTAILPLLQSLKTLSDPNQELLNNIGLQSLSLDDKSYQQQCHQLHLTIEQKLFGMELEQWQNLTLKDFETWVNQHETAATPLLRHVLEEDWGKVGKTSFQPIDNAENTYIGAQLVSDQAENFVREPSLNGIPLETGAAVRQQSHPLSKAIAQRYGNGLLHRLTSRLCDIAEMVISLPTQLESTPQPKDKGLSCVETARGKLWHKMSVEDGIVTSYHVLAPTEWNFHPQGVAAASLVSMMKQAKSQLRTQAELLIHAIDPCVGYTLKLEGAHA
jgi:hypothetical protein